MPINIRRYLEASSGETPKPNELESGCEVEMLATNEMAVEAAAEYLRSQGFGVTVEPSDVEGEAQKVGREFARRARELNAGQAIVAGGETTVHVTGSGKGGRNQELALAAAMELDGEDDTMVLALATDGKDGPTDSAGGIVDSCTIRKGRDLNLDPQCFLDNNDAYHYLKKVDGLLYTGPTHTNVMDVIVCLCH